jgi:hypothetical protein
LKTERKEERSSTRRNDERHMRRSARRLFIQERALKLSRLCLTVWTLKGNHETLEIRRINVRLEVFMAVTMENVSSEI